MRTLVAAIFATLLLTSGALAQQGRPLPQQDSDPVAAEREATQALSTAEAETGDSAATAAAALRLATLRLSQHAPDALSPAQRAYDLARRLGAGSGVAVLDAQLVLGRAMLVSDSAAAIPLLTDGLLDAQRQPIVTRFALPAAEQLGAWALAHEQFDLAQASWAQAVRFAPPGDATTFRRARAMTLEAVSMAAPYGDTRRHIPADTSAAILALLKAAAAALHPLALTNDAEVTPAQQMYAQALAWNMIVQSKIVGEGHSVPEVDEPTLDDHGATPECIVSMHRTSPDFPRDVHGMGAIGVAVVRMRFDPNDGPSKADLAAGVGSQSFLDATARVLGSWTATFDPNDPPGCRRPSVRFVIVNFSQF